MSHRTRFARRSGRSCQFVRKWACQGGRSSGLSLPICKNLRVGYCTIRTFFITLPSIPPPLVSGVLFNLICKVMNTKSKTYYDIVPKDLDPVVVLRFKSLPQAIEYMRENHMGPTWIIVSTRIDL